MRYFSSQLLNSSRIHADWWGEVSADREWFHKASRDANSSAKTSRQRKKYAARLC